MTIPGDFGRGPPGNTGIAHGDELAEDGRVEIGNVGAQLINGFEVSESIGQHFSYFHTEEDRAAGIIA